MSTPDHTLEITRSASGERLLELGRYQLLRVLGGGGMGQVYEAWDTLLERRVAIKILRHEHSDEHALREARHLARVAHPKVVEVYDVGRSESLLVFIAMELVDGSDLRSWLCAGRRRWTQVLDHLIAAAEGLAAVHHAGLVHGDVKPGNVLVGEDGRVRIADFGLARVRAREPRPDLQAVVRRALAAEVGELDSQPAPALRFDELFLGSGPAPGTRAYMAPERLGGAKQDEGGPADQAGQAGQADQAARAEQADQYSFCVMAWEALFGVRPFAGDNVEAVLAAIAAGRLERRRGRPRGMPRAVEAVLRRGLSERAQERWPSMEALTEALRRARSRPRRWLLRAARLGLVLLIVGLAGRQPLFGSSGGAFVDHVLCTTAGPRAVALARAGEGERALQVLVNAQLRASESQLRSLAVASQQVAVELEAHGAWEDASLAWGFSIKIARVAGDDVLEQIGREGVYAAFRHMQSSTAPPR